MYGIFESGLLFRKTLWDALGANEYIYLPPGHPIIAIWNNRNQNGHCICKTVYLITFWSTGQRWRLTQHYHTRALFIRLFVGINSFDRLTCPMYNVGGLALEIVRMVNLRVNYSAINPVIYLNVCPSYRIGPTQGQRKTLTRVGLESTTSGSEFPRGWVSLCPFQRKLSFN